MPTTPKPRRRRRWLLIAPLLLIVAVVGYIAFPKKDTFTVGPETTYVTGPLDADGRVDYVAALNTRLRGDITPEQNANVLIWQAIGPRPEGRPMPDEYFQWLGAAAPPEAGTYFVQWHTFAQDWDQKRRDPALLPPAPDDVRHAARHDRARQWPWAAAAEPDLAAWLAKIDAPLALLDRATARPAYYNPLLPKRGPDGRAGLLYGGSGTVMIAHRAAATALLCRAMMRLGAGQPDAAWRDLMTCHRLGRLWEGGGSVTEYLVGVGVQMTAMRGEAVFLSRAKLTAAQLAACQADLGRLPAPTRVADKADLVERFTVLDALQHIARDGPGSEAFDLVAGADRPAAERWLGRAVDWDPPLRLANRMVDRLAAVLREDGSPARDAALGDLGREMDNKVAEVARDENDRPAAFRSPAARVEVVARVLVGLSSLAAKLAVTEDRVAQQRRTLSVAVALAAYRLDRGAYPETLADVAPKYLPEIPADVCSGKPLKYRRTAAGYRLHSVGANHADDEGRSFQDDPKGDDMLIEMPAKEPPPVKKPEPAAMPDDDPE